MQIPSTQGAPQASNIAVQDALPLVGTPSRENGQSVLNAVDADLSKLFEDRNALLTGGGDISFTTTAATFTADFILYINSNIAGASPYTITIPFSGSPWSFSSDGNMAYITITSRSAGTFTLSTNQTTLPAVVSANKEVFLIAKRVGTNLIFRDGTVIPTGRTVKLGADDLYGSLGSTTNALVKTNGTDGKTVQGTGIIVDSSNNISGVGTIGSGAVTSTGESKFDGIYSGSGSKDASAVIQMDSTSKGILPPRMTTTQRDAISTPATGLLIYNTTTKAYNLYNGTAWIEVGSGAGGGSKNYLTSYNSNPGNGNFELGSTSGWSLFNTTLTSLIPTGSITAGAASITTFDIITSGQLAGLDSLRTASSAAWAAGQGYISDAFAIDSEDQAKVLAFKLYYSCFANPTNGNFSGTSSNTFAVYIYDVTNGAWIQPAGVYGITQSSGAGFVTGTFQTTYNSTQYRIAVLAVNASSGAITMYWDDFSVGPQITAIGAAVTDWQSYPPTFTGFGTVSTKAFFSRRVGDSLEIYGFFLSGTVTATEARITIGYAGGNGNVVVDNTKVVGQSLVGSAVKTSSSTTFFGVYPLAGNNTNYLNFGVQTSTTGATQVALGTAFSNTDYIEIHATVPIVGWSSNVQMSNDTDTRVVAMLANGTVTGSLGAAYNTVIFGTTINDTHGGYNASTGIYTAPVSGYYDISGGVTITGNYTAGLFTILTIYRNGVNIAGRQRFMSTGTVASVAVDLTTMAKSIYCKAGDTLNLASYSTGTTLTYSSGAPFFSIARISGPSVIAANETVAAKYKNTAGTALVYNVNTILPFPTKLYDTHGAYNTSTGLYTVPVSGKYRVSAKIVSAIVLAVAGQQFAIGIYKNGSLGESIGLTVTPGITSYWPSYGTTTIDLLAGDTLGIYYYQSFYAAGTTLITEAWQNHFEIERIGN